jgi:predicted ABC-type ATPase
VLGVESPKDTVWIINPDLLAKRISEQENLALNDANLEAVIRIEKWLYASVEAYQTIGVETVLSSPKYRRLVETAKSKGFKVNLIYVYLDDVELNIERVRNRFQKGGHDVPESKIRERRARSLEQFKWFYEAADEAIVLNNSGAELRIVASKEEKLTAWANDILPEIEAVVSKPRNFKK